MSNIEIMLNDVQTFASEKVILSAQTEKYVYENGNRTDKVTGIKVTVVANKRSFMSFNVKIEGGKLLKVTDEEIDEACASMKPIWVRFTDFKAKPYVSSNGKGIAYSCSASSVELVEADEVDIF